MVNALGQHRPVFSLDLLDGVGTLSFMTNDVLTCWRPRDLPREARSRGVGGSAR